MLNRVAAAVTVLLLALVPALRSLCDVNCMAAARHAHQQAVPGSNHCSIPPEHSSTPADSCGHDHSRSLSTVSASKVSVPLLALVTSIDVSRAIIVPFGAAATAPEVHTSPPVGLRSVALRI
jgi:hypothetical protein